ncbi:MAG: cyclic nucleotide-binding domain-containing protein, partial [Bacteroidota bacterium]
MASDFTQQANTFFSQSTDGFSFDQFPQLASRYFQPRTLTRGTSWLRPGQVCGRIAFIKSGMLRAFVETDTGKHTRWAFLPGQFFTSVTSFGQQLPAEEHIEALEDSELMEITHTNWQMLS